MLQKSRTVLQSTALLVFDVVFVDYDVDDDDDDDGGGDDDDGGGGDDVDDDDDNDDDLIYNSHTVIPVT